MAWFKMYPGDWLKDDRLRRCSFNGKGVWIDVICLSFEYPEKGVFFDENGPVSEAEILDSLSGKQADKKRGWAELLKRGIIKQDDRGAFYAKRLRDEYHLSEVRSACGSLGGNPSLLDNQKDNQDLNQTGNQKGGISDIRGKNPEDKDLLLRIFIAAGFPKARWEEMIARIDKAIAGGVQNLRKYATQAVENEMRAKGIAPERSGKAKAIGDVVKDLMRGGRDG